MCNNSPVFNLWLHHVPNPYMIDSVTQAPDGRYLRPDITDNKDATVTVHYTPEDVGKYNAKIKYGGDPIPGSPFDVNTRPSGDASKCQITGMFLYHLGSRIF